MQRAVRHRIELHVARQHAVLLAGELDVEQGRIEGLLVMWRSISFGSSEISAGSFLSP